MNSNRFILMLGLLIIMILSIGSISAVDADDSVDLDLTDEGAVDSVDNSNIDAVDVESEDNADIDSDIKTDAKDALKSNEVNSNSLASTISFTQSSYSTYFNSSGNIISGKLNAGDILDFSGNFSGKSFIIDIPLTITSSDNTAYLKNCAFSFINGSSGSNISNIKANTSVTYLPVISVTYVENMTLSNNNIFSNGTKSHPMILSNVYGMRILNNTLQTTGYVVGWGHPSALVLEFAGGCNISGNTVITNDSNGIYFSGYSSSSSMGSGNDAESHYNYIVNNTVYSSRTVPSSFMYAIAVMSSNNFILNNTIFNAYRAIYISGSNNQIIGNNISNIHGSYYSDSDSETGADYAIYAGSNALVKDNIISDCIFSSSLKGAAIFAGKCSNVTGNIMRNITGMGVYLGGDNSSFTYNDLNVSDYGVYIFGEVSNIEILLNIIDSNNQSNIKLEKQSRVVYPYNILIANNALYNLGAVAIDVASECENITIDSNLIIGGESNSSVNESAVHYIDESNFDTYFSTTGNLENIIKENDTLIFIGNFSSKNKLYINQKVTIEGFNAVFYDTTFIINNDNVVIDNLVITNPNTNLKDRLWGIQVNGVNNVTIKNCDISIYDPYSAYAIYLLEASNCNIINNKLEAKGNYFTVALLSFNSKNITVEGNSIKTVGSGETYLLNNRSCLDGYLSLCLDGSIICSDGTVVCPDGYEICTDGSLLCPDGSIISSGDYTVCVDGSIICTDGTIICADGTTASGSVCTDGSIVCTDGTTYCLDGTVILSNGTRLLAGGYSLSADNSTLICPDGTVCTDGFTVCQDGSVVCADGTTYCTDGSVICADGTTYCTDGSVICADGTTYYSNGTVVYANGTICTDGANSSSVLDGVIPGSHMVSGVYKTYGVLLIHTSNSNLIDNTIEVGSELPSDYDLNESYNTIAGVFIHYGGFNNTISNNSILLSSNDPVMYGIGIIGASPNSTAEGSKNNNFTNNFVSIIGPFYGAGITLGYKAIESNFINNSFEILTDHPFNTITVSGSENNTLDGNTFITKIGTTVNVSDATFTFVDSDKVLSVTVYDESGQTLQNKDIVLTVDGKNYTATTNDIGIAYVKLNLSAVGSYTVTSSFKGDAYYRSSSGTASVVISKTKTSVGSTAKTYTTSYSSKYIYITLKDVNGKVMANKKVSATVNGKTVSAYTNSKGVASLKLSLSVVKTYTVSIKFAGDSSYLASSGTVKVKITKAKTKLTVPAKTYKRSAKTKKLKATLKTTDGKILKNKKVKFKVNGKTYTAKTNSKGVATVKVKLTVKKKYKVTVKYAGSSYYKAVTKKSTVKIK